MSMIITGTLVNKELTSNDTMIMLGTFTAPSFSISSNESLTQLVVKALSTGFGTSASYFANGSKVERVIDTIGLRGTLSLRTFGRPYMRGTTAH